MASNKKQRRASNSAVLFAELCKVLSTKAKTREELAELTGITPGTVSRWLRLLRERHLIYVAYWVKHGTSWTACWSWGHPLNSVSKPAKVPSAEASRRWRVKQAKLKSISDKETK